MSYTAYERTSGTSVINEVKAMEQNLTEDGIFGSDTTPTLSQVEEFITDTYHEIGVYLVMDGYAKTQTDADVVGALQHYNSLGACAKIELTQPSVGYKAGENTRYDRFFTEFMKVKDLINSIAFERLGASRTWPASAGLSAGGISIDDKNDIETDSDFEPYMFTKDKMRHPGSLDSEEL
ncbi:hypothetical protein LCGC14_1476660 [marine sediment metagenome]|uniref:Uncharacterized protein n=1 Tax=marine sediment metagenome TaxID=412755 RepID=A0A0F9LR93_9ZZZZ